MNSNEDAYNANLDLAIKYSEDQDLSKEPGRKKEINSYNSFRLDYYRSVNYIDRYVGEIMDKLKALSRDKDTMVVFTSDHGDMLGEHGLNLKMCFYDASVKVPLLIHIPGQWEDSEFDDRPVMQLDLVPTIAKQFNIETENNLPGIDLVNDSYGYDRPVYSEMVSSFGADVAQYGYENHVRMVKTDKWKYFAKAFGSDELYDLTQDPKENNNLGQNLEYESICNKMKILIDQNLGQFKVDDIKIVG